MNGSAANGPESRKSGSGGSSPITLVWMRRDLRLADNPALSAAQQDGVPVPVYLYTPDEEHPWEPGGATRWYLHHSLLALQSALRRQGLELAVERAQATRDSAALLLEQVRHTGASRVFWNRVYEPALLARDARVKEALQRAGVEVRIFHDYSLLPPGSVLTQSGDPYRVFTPFWKRLSSMLWDSAAEQRLRGGLPTTESSSRTPGDPPPSSIDALGLLDDHPWHDKLSACWQPGEEAANQRLGEVARRLADYPSQRDIPAVDGTSSLSAALHFGEVSVWRVFASCQPAWLGERDGAAGAGAEGLIRQLAWREFAINLLYQHPRSAAHSLRPGFDDSGLWREQPDYLDAWQRGQTGFALVDAGMRQLWQTGWMHNRVRMVAASLLTKNLGVHWIHGARWFWDTLVDADLANNSMGWQWVGGSGCDAAPYYRIFNPETQAKRFDPQRQYIAHWLDPERAASPLIDLAASRNAALERYQNRN